MLSFKQGTKVLVMITSVKHELRKVSNVFKEHNVVSLLDSEATVNNVLSHVQSSAWLHLACHAYQDTANPLKGGLLLHDGTLELGQILNVHLPNAKFVFLSACETAMGDEKLMNESMHLTGGFMAAGFQGIIGTLWSMSDLHGPAVAEGVYKKVLEGSNVPDVTLAAEGLHLAIQDMRSRGTPFERWLPYIHVGV